MGAPCSNGIFHSNGRGHNGGLQVGGLNESGRSDALLLAPLKNFFGFFFLAFFDHGMKVFAYHLIAAKPIQVGRPYGGSFGQQLETKRRTVLNWDLILNEKTKINLNREGDYGHISLDAMKEKTSPAGLVGKTLVRKNHGTLTFGAQIAPGSVKPPGCWF
jgi:hypothetical protein